MERIHDRKSPLVPIIPETTGLNLFPQNPRNTNTKNGIRTIQTVYEKSNIFK
jgi:hypothetical protein